MSRNLGVEGIRLIKYPAYPSGEMRSLKGKAEPPASVLIGEHVTPSCQEQGDNNSSRNKL